MDLMSEDYKQQNIQLHKSGKYGKWGYREADNILAAANFFECENLLDFGAGQGSLSKSLPLNVTNYDPAIEEYNTLPDDVFEMTNCSDVLEHIEPDYLDNVLETIKFYTEKVAYFVIATTPDGTKKLPDGRDPHLIVESAEWWVEKLSEYFKIYFWYQKDKRGAVVVICLNE